MNKQAVLSCKDKHGFYIKYIFETLDFTLILCKIYSKRQRILLIQSGELRVESGVIAIQILDKIRI